VTNIEAGSLAWLYESIYCACGQAENLIKLHKTQLASDRTSCRSPLANQMRLILHTAAYRLVHAVRAAIPQPLARAEFATLRLRLFKLAVRVTETATRVRLAFAAAHPEAVLFRSLVRAFYPQAP
jgi:DDE family transposase